MVRTVTSKIKHTVVHETKRGAKNVKAVAGEAIGAAAKAARDCARKNKCGACRGPHDTYAIDPAISRAAEKTPANRGRAAAQLAAQKNGLAASGMVRRSKAAIATMRRRKKARRKTR